MTGSSAKSVGKTGNTKSWAAELAKYRDPNLSRSLFEIIVTVVPFLCLWGASAAAVIFGQYWGLLLTLPASGFLVRLFILQHDCGHGSLFAHRALNDWVGRIIGVFTLTPYDYWRRTHAVHHASAGNLDRRGIGDIDTLTVREYRALNRWGRLKYRLYRHPVIMFGLGPAWLFVCQYRLPFGLMRSGVLPWASTILTNLAIIGPIVFMIWLVGLVPFLMVQIPITLFAATGGVWLFYVQHQFEDTHWSENCDWDFSHSALHGSSHYDLPRPIRWLTGNIGIHHVHHLAARIPFYRLPEVLRDYPELRTVSRITFLESLKCVKLVLWDENARKLISFQQERAIV